MTKPRLNLATIWHSPEVWTFFSMAMRLGAWVFLIPLITTRIPKAELGLWYVFMSLNGLFGLLEFGFGNNVTRAAGYLWAGATELQAFGVASAAARANRAPNIELLTKLVATLRVYYRGAGLIVYALAVSIGGWWVGRKTEGLSGGAWQLAWSVFALGLLITFWGGLWGALLMGIGRVKQSQQIALLGQCVYYVVSIIGLAAGGGIWALVMASLLMGLAMRWSQARLFWQAIGPHGKTSRPDWQLMRQLWPNSWRLGVVWVGGWLIVQANTLICSAYLGLAETASYGLSMQMINLIGGLSVIWVSTQQPLINQLRANHDTETIARLFATRMRWLTLTFLGLGLGLSLLGPFLLERIHARTGLLPVPLLLLFLLVSFLETHYSQYSILVQSENRNPFVVPTLISGAAVVGLSLWLTPLLGVLGMLLAQGLVQASFNYWWPIVRAMRGLGESRHRYWGYFFGFLSARANISGALPVPQSTIGSQSINPGGTAR